MHDCVHIRVANRMAEIVGDYDYERLIKYWSFAVPSFRFFQSKYPGWDGRIKLLKRNRLPAGLFWATYHDIQNRENIEFKISTDLDYPEYKTENVLVADQEHYYQNECRQALIKTSKFGGGLVLNATGSGKTRVAAMYFSTLKGYGLFVVDQLHLLRQARLDIQEALKEKVGFVGESKFKPRRITVATIQTLRRYRNSRKFRKWWKKIEVMFIDEIHVQMNRSNFDVVTTVRPKCVFGLTATLKIKEKPIRLKAWSLCGPVCYEYPLRKGMDEKVLSKGVVLRILYPAKIALESFIGASQNSYVYNTQKSYRRDGGTAKARETASYAMPKRLSDLRNRNSFIKPTNYDVHIVHNHERNHLITRLVRSLWHQGKCIVVLVRRIKHLKILHKRLKDIPHKLAWGGVNVAKRIKYSHHMETGSLRLILANDVFKKGVNIKRLDAVIDAVGSPNPDDAIQKFGRGVRLHSDKHGLLYFDIADQDPEIDYIKDRNHSIDIENEKRRRRNKKRLRIGKEPLPLIPRLKAHNFHVAAEKRRRAFQAAGIRIEAIRWTNNPEHCCEIAEKLLNQEINQGGNHRNS